MIQASKQEHYDKASEYLENVVKNFNNSDKYDFEGMTLSLKGSYSFYKSEMDPTIDYYKTALDNDQGLINPFIGMAQVHFAKRNYEEALMYFKKALKLKPDIPAHGRLGMAYCFLNLGKYTLAEHTFNRIL